MLTYGGNIIDADVVAPRRRSRIATTSSAMTPLINISSTVNVQEIDGDQRRRNGEPAILRTAGVDDLLDAIDTTNAIKGFVGMAIDPALRPGPRSSPSRS